MPRAASVVTLTATANAPSQTAESPLEQYRELARLSKERLHTFSGYTATLWHQVRKGDSLLEPDKMQIKLRHEPFSVYMNFVEKGQQVLYVDGKNDGRLLWRKTQGLLQRTFSVEPTNRFAMMRSRQPITDLGLLGLVLKSEQILDGCPPQSDVRCEITSAEVGEEPVRQYTLTFATPAVQDTYSKCVICFRVEEPIPVCVACYGWTDDGQPGELIEYYCYQNVRFDAPLTDLDFDSENAAYAFRD